LKLREWGLILGGKTAGSGTQLRTEGTRVDGTIEKSLGHIIVKVGERVWIRVVKLNQHCGKAREMSVFLVGTTGAVSGSRQDFNCLKRNELRWLCGSCLRRLRRCQNCLVFEWEEELDDPEDTMK